MGMGMAAAAAVYSLGWFDASVVCREEGWVLGATCWCGWYVFVRLVRRDWRALFDKRIILIYLLQGCNCRYHNAMDDGIP
jgi:hypothetical protein